MESADFLLDYVHLTATNACMLPLTAAVQQQLLERFLIFLHVHKAEEKVMRPAQRSSFAALPTSYQQQTWRLPVVLRAP